jgi:hypothetical protein
MKKLYFGLVLLVLFGCDSGKGTNERALLDSLNAAMAIQEPAISEEVVADIIQNIPSPLEISVLLKEAGTKYDKSLLNSPDNTHKYNNNFKKALNLGIYGTDLGYTNIFEQNQDALFYLNSIKDLADGLNIGQFFDFGTIKRLATHSRNLDSLLLITTKNFNNINSYLQDQRRANLSILLLSGGWLEALHISCQVYKKNPKSSELRDKIGEQKIILENISLLLSFYAKNDPNIEMFLADLAELQNAFSKIEIIRVYKESTFEEVDGVLVIRDNSTSTVNITDENVAEITKITDSIRKKIII